LSFSGDGINFETLQEPLFPFSESSWLGRSSTSSELVAYSSIVPRTGGNSWENGFYLFYTYLQPGEDFDKRYLVRRWVEVEQRSEAVSPQVWLALSQYYSDSKQDFWATTAMVPAGYSFQKTYGYVYTKYQEGMTELVDCYIYLAGWDDHMVAPGGCGTGEVSRLRSLGWIWAAQKTGTIPLYMCYNAAATDHSISTDPACAGQGEMEYQLGFVGDPAFEPQPPSPPSGLGFR
jgi:hypothetical protein